MDLETVINTEDYEIGVIVARFQIHELHEAHVDLIKIVTDNHHKVIIFLGVPVISNTKRNPLDFATRKAMVQTQFPDVVILPLKDQRSNASWSYILDNEIKVPFGERTTLLYGSRDSFIQFYEGRHQTTELIPDTYLSGTEIRKQISRELRNSKDFRAGVIHATYSRRPITYSTVDICPYNKQGQILLGKKPNENVWRFIGGFVDRTDDSDEFAASRELREEAGQMEIGEMKYITSKKVDDWRYAKEEDGIMTRLFICEYLWGKIEPNDDISELKWFDLETFQEHDNIQKHIMPEHCELMRTLVNKVTKEKLITKEK